MSRAYRIKVSESVTRHIRVSDGVRSQLSLLQVLPAAQMSDILGAQLEARGFARDPEDPSVMRRTDDDGIAIEVALETGTVTVRLEREVHVELSADRTASAYDETAAQIKTRLTDEVKRDLERQTDDERGKLTDEVAAVLEKKLRDLKREFDQVANKTTAEALVVRARQMGEIKEISEDPETGSLTIKVEV